MNSSAAIFLAFMVFLSRTGSLEPMRVNFGRKVPGYTLFMSQVVFLHGSSVLGTTAYANSGPWFNWNALRVQTGLTA